MSWFVVIGALLLVAILGALLYPLLAWRGAARSAAGGVRDLNLAILREHFSELEKDFQGGRLDPASYRQARQELERRTLDDAGPGDGGVRLGGRKIKLALALGVLFPVLLFALYAWLGTPAALTGRVPAKAAGEGEHALSREQIAGMVDKLALRLQENPADGPGWLMLGRSYAVLGRYPESAAAFDRALGLLPPDAQHYADFADIAAMAQGRSFAGAPEKLVQRALAIDPRNIKALALAGTVAFDQQNYSLAIRQWQKVLALIPDDSAVAAGIRGSIRDAENRLAISGQQVADAPPGGADGVAPAAKVAGSVELDAKFRSQVAPGDTLFIFARAVDGPKMPVAMLRKKVGDLPLQFALDDSMSMTPQFKLSTVGKVVIGARISRSGDALARAGDIEGVSAPVAVGTAGIKVTIGHVVR
ncbi:MAG: ccmI [Proteobacteria bacterium]|nr:ccmI [Pseudomonadota bacterium]